jgi:hypothetical protein
MRLRRLLISAAAGLCLIAAPMAGAAHAFTPAPSCVEQDIFEEDSPDWGFLYNACSTTQRVKMIIAFEGDSPCWTLAPGQYSDEWYWADWGSFDGVALC